MDYAWCVAMKIRERVKYVFGPKLDLVGREGQLSCGQQLAKGWAGKTTRLRRAKRTHGRRLRRRDAEA